MLKLSNKIPASAKTVLKRITFSIILVTGFLLLIFGGPPIIILSMLIIQMKCFHEVISVAYNKYGIEDIPSFKYISTYLVVVANFHFGVENSLEYFKVYTEKFGVHEFTARYYKFISFCLYFMGLIWFVVSLRKKYCRKQFCLLAWTHLIIIIIVFQAQLIFRTLFQGMIWFYVCITAVACNDIMAYVCGKFFGKTLLIQLSPKKTWEGFIGAAVLSLAVTCVTCYYLCEIDYFVCPVHYENINDTIVRLTECKHGDIFELSGYDIYGWTLRMYPFVFHAALLSIFASLIAPFGGFFASGFKRAFNIKDFANTIPGHGGIMDRFDCQFLMVTFMHVYISTFVGSDGDDSEVLDLFQRVLNLNSEKRIEIFYCMQEKLIRDNLIML